MKKINLFQISDSEKDIMTSVVYCIHHKEGCKWSDQLKKLKVNIYTIVIIKLFIKTKDREVVLYTEIYKI